MRRTLLAGCTAAAVALGMAPVSALAADATQLPEVLIQARRITENQQHTPVASTTLNNQVLQLDTVTESSELQKSVPSFEIQPSQFGGDADPVFTIRGFSPNQSTDLTDPAVIGYFDGVAQDPRNYAYSMYDLDSVQVLKGPQGTLFGRNSTGGAVLFQPMHPGKEFGGFVDFRWGSLNDNEATFALNLPVNDQLQFRIAGEREERDGSLKSDFGHFAYNNRDHGSLRAEMAWKPNDTFDNYLQATTYTVKEINNAPVLKFVNSACPPPGPGGFPTGLGECYFQPFIGGELAQQQADGRDRTPNATPAPFHVLYNGVTDIAQVHLGEFSIRNIFHYDTAKYLISTDFDGSNAPIVNQANSENNRYWTDEFQFIGKSLDNRLDWIVGYFYSDLEQHQSNFFQQLDFPGNPIGEVFVNDTVPQKSQAVYAHLNMNLDSWLHGFSIAGGYRYTWDQKTFTDQRLAPGVVGPPFFLPNSCAFPVFGFIPGVTYDPVSCTRRLSAKWQDDTWDVSLNWQANANTLVYLAARKGYEAGGFNFIADNPAFFSYAPEEVRDVELGLKADWNLGSMPVRTNLAIYRASYTNIQISTIDFVDAPIPQVLIENRDALGRSNKATLQGGELEVTMIPCPSLTVTGFYGYAQGKYDTFTTIGGLGLIDLHGQNISGIIPVTDGLRVVWSPDVAGDWGRPSFSVVVYNQTTQTSNAASSNTLGEAGFTDVDLRFDWRHFLGSPADIAVYGKNVGNERHVTFGNDLTGLANVKAVEWSPASAWGLEIRVPFGAGS